MDRRNEFDGVVDGVGFDLFEAIVIAFGKAIAGTAVVEEVSPGADGQHFPWFGVKVMLLDSTGRAIFTGHPAFDSVVVVESEFVGAVKRHRLLAGRFDFGRDLSAEVTRSVVLTSIRWGQSVADGSDDVDPPRSFERGPRPGAGPGRTGLSGARNHSEGEERESQCRSRFHDFIRGKVFYARQSAATVEWFHRRQSLCRGIQTWQLAGAVA